MICTHESENVHSIQGCVEVMRNLSGMSLIETPIDDYLMEKDEALMPLDELEESESSVSEEGTQFNANIIIYSNRTERSVYDSVLNDFLKTEHYF